MPVDSRSTPPQAEPDSTRPPEGTMSFGRVFAAMAFSVIFIVLIALAVRYLEMVTGRYLDDGVPPMPAFAALLVLSLLHFALRRTAPRLVPTHNQMLLVYAMVTTASLLMGAYHIRAFLPHLVAMQYWQKKNP